VPSAARVAKNEGLFREVNERILELEERFGEREPDESWIGFVCECSRAHCTSRIELTTKEYREVRRNPTRFVIVPGHVDPEHERVVDETDRYAVVEKFGVAGSIAEDDAAG
jgi:hypothetical protein